MVRRNVEKIVVTFQFNKKKQIKCTSKLKTKLVHFAEIKSASSVSQFAWLLNLWASKSKTEKRKGIAK